MIPRVSVKSHVVCKNRWKAQRRTQCPFNRVKTVVVCGSHCLSPRICRSHLSIFWPQASEADATLALLGKKQHDKSSLLADTGDGHFHALTEELIRSATFKLRPNLAQEHFYGVEIGTLSMSVKLLLFFQSTQILAVGRLGRVRAFAGWRF